MVPSPWQSGGPITLASDTRIAVEGQLKGTSTRLIAQLVDEARGTVSHAEVLRGNPRGCCDGDGPGGVTDPGRPPYHFSTYLPNVAAGTSIRITDEDGQVVWERRPSGEPPRFSSLTAEMGPELTLVLGWVVESAADAVEIWAQWSKDEGTTWHGLVIDLADGRAVLPLTGLPPGCIQIRLLAHDGFYSTPSEPVTVEVPTLPPIVTIINPVEGEEYTLGQPMQLSGNVIDNEGFPLEADLDWYLDGRRVGTGREAWIAMPQQPGTHEVDLRAGEAAQTVRFAISAQSR